MALHEQLTNDRVSMDTWPKCDLEHVSGCPICGEDERKVLYTGLTDEIFRCASGTWTLWSCSGCSAAYLDPRPNVQSIARAYARYYTHSGDDTSGHQIATLKALVKRAKLYAAHDFINSRWGYSLRPALLGGRVLSALPSFSRFAEISIRHLPQITDGCHTLLDVGCGDGGFLLEAERIGYEAIGLEPDDAAAKKAKQSGLKVKAGHLPTPEFSHNSFSQVTMSHVIEHLHDPLGTLREIYMLLRPQGRLWIATPNLSTVQHYKSRALAYHLDPPRHLILFDRHSLELTLQRAGFTSIQIAAPMPYEKRIFKPAQEATSAASSACRRDETGPALKALTSVQQDEQGEELFAVAYKD